MAGALCRCLNASAMNCQVVTTTSKLHSYVSSPLLAHPRLRPCRIGNCGIRVELTALLSKGWGCSSEGTEHESVTVFFGAWQSAVAQSLTPLSALRLPDRLEAQAYGLP